MTFSGRDAIVRAEALVGPFCRSIEDFAEFRPVASAAVPEPFRFLLDHDSHMTVALERFHGAPVRVRVLQELHGTPATRYSREILLTVPDAERQDGRVVQHGIVSIDLTTVDDAIATRIRRCDEPLGRILLDAGVLCSVRDVHLLAIVPGPRLRDVLGPADTFGRVARILVDGRPAIELLEIVQAA